jgi:hypothetical protein
MAFSSREQPTQNPNLPTLPLSESTKADSPMETSFHYNFWRIRPGGKGMSFCAIFVSFCGQPKASQTALSDGRRVVKPPLSEKCCS